MRGPGTSTLRLALGAALAVAGQPSPAGAQEARAAATCPAREALLTAVHRLVSASGRAADADGDIEVRDLGDRYSVTVLGYTRVYVDEARDCAARAQNAAVFAALTLYPPDIEAPRRAPGPRPDPARPALRPAPPSPSPAPPSPLPAPAPPAPVTVSGPAQPAASGHSVTVEIGVFGADAPATSGAFALGADASVAVAWPSVGVAFGGAFAAPITLELDAARVRLRRFPFHVSGRIAWRSQLLRAALELGPLAALLQARQADAKAGEARGWIDPGFRGALTLALEGARIGPYLRVFSEVTPFGRELAVEPRGVVGRTPALWLGAGIGVASRFD
ncbi:hypothetical protein WMF37_02010 [Sorangium sp. So ce291]|uniref:hypothetical protein n=1 Tax=Sorangium sp. So ce291 TaxID=3133294 RepID=UPI003F5DBF8B